MANADRKPKKREKYVDTELRLPRPLVEAVDQIVATGILGMSRNDVLAHILRQALYETFVKHGFEE